MRSAILAPLLRLFAVGLAVALLAGACTIAADTRNSALSAEENSGSEGANALQTADEPTAVVEPTPSPAPTSEATTAEAAPLDPDSADPDSPNGALADPDGFDDVVDQPLALDADVLVGELENGLTYFVRRNLRPGAQAHLLLAVDVGSIHEPEQVGGIAHFTEHMMFNGTKRFPNNDLIPVLEGFGAAFGPDINAYTGFEETVYSLVVPSRDVEVLQLGIDVLREWAGEATLTEQAVADERGVVREELRLSTESSSSRVGDALRSALLEGTVFDEQLPIGTLEAVESMNAADLRDFYDTWYRPERMSVIAVGDFDPGDVERRIVETFGDLTERAPAIDLDLELGSGSLRTPTFDVLLDDEINRSQIDVVWRLDRRAMLTEQAVRSGLLTDVTAELLRTRLFEAIQAPGSTLINHSLEAASFTSNFELLSIDGTADAAAMNEALAQIITEVERARQHGFADDEFERAVETFRVVITQEYAERATRQDGTIANELVEVALGTSMLQSADDRFETFNAALDSLTPADAQNFVEEIASDNPYVLVSGPTELGAELPEPEELAATFDNTQGVPVAPRTQSDATVDALMVAPEPAAIISTERIDPINATVVTFANGARMAYRPTAIADNVIEFSAVSKGGFFATDGPETPLLSSISGSILGSGFASIDAVTLGRFASGTSATLSGAVGRSYERLGGAAATTDLEVLLQLAHLQMTEPALEAAQVRQFEEFMRPLATDPQSRPNLAASLELWTQRYGKSPWYRLIPTVEDLDALDADLLLSAWGERYANAGDFIFLFVGDIDEDELLDLGARYLGTLPATDEREVVISRDPGVPQENLVSTVEAGISDQGLITWNWESPYPFTVENRVIADLLLIVVNARLRDRIREELGGSYSPSAEATILSQPEPWIDTTLQVAGDPDRLPELADAVRQELTKLRSGDIDPSYLELAIDQQVEEYSFFTNGDWLNELEIQLFNPERGDGEIWERDRIAALVTLDEIVAAANVVFPADRSVEVRLVPAR